MNGETVAKFKVGDKVRTLNEETPPPASEYGVGKYDTIYSIEPNGGYRLFYSEGIISRLIWFDDELEPYTA